MKACVDSLCHFVNTHRMVRDYVEGYYMKAHAHFRELEADDAQRARELTAAMDRIRREWRDVWVARVEDGPVNTIPVATAMSVDAQVHLGRLSPQDVARGALRGTRRHERRTGRRPIRRHGSAGKDSEGNYNYVVETAVDRSGLHGFTVRVRPYHPDMSVAFIPGLICWADESRVAAAVQPGRVR